MTIQAMLLLKELKEDIPNCRKGKKGDYTSAAAPRQKGRRRASVVGRIPFTR